MNPRIRSFVLILTMILFTVGCFGYRHKEYTFDEKFDYHSGKVMKHIKKVVSDEGKLGRIEKKILPHKAGLKDLFESVKKDKDELINHLLKTKDKEEVKNRLKKLADKKIDMFSLLVDLMFEIKDELSEEEWEKIAKNFNEKCSHWWK